MTREQFLLIKLSEECAEVSQRASKQIQFGRDQVQKGNEVKGGTAAPEKEAGLTNGQRLRGEIMDVLAILKLLEGEAFEPFGIFDSYEVVVAAEKKLEKIRKYLAFSQGLGMIGQEVTL